MVEKTSLRTRDAAGEKPGRRISRRGVVAGVLGLGALGAWAGYAYRRAELERRFPPEGVFETVEGVRLHVLDRGPREATAVVLIHGASGNLRDFGFGFSERLLSRYRAIAIDRPGFGYSERGPGEAWRPDRQARLMRGALARRGVERAIVLGHSWGASAALAWALDAPDTVIGVVDAAGAAMPWPGGHDLLYDVASTPVLGHIATNAIGAALSDGFIEERIGAIFAPQTPPDGYLKGVGAPLAIRAETLRHNGRDVAELSPYLKEQSKRYAALAAPVEIVHGDADAIVPAATHSEPLARTAPDAALTLLPGIGHMPHHAAPEAVIAAIDRLAARA